MDNKVSNLGQSLLFYEEELSGLSFIESDFISAIDSSLLIIKNSVDEVPVLSINFINYIHNHISNLIGVKQEFFTDNNYSDDDFSWIEFAQILDENSYENFDNGGYCWILSKLYSGGHFISLRFTIGWQIMNAILLKHKRLPVFPPISIKERLINYLKGQYDESLRALTLEFITLEV